MSHQHTFDQIEREADQQLAIVLGKAYRIALLCAVLCSIKPFARAGKSLSRKIRHAFAEQ